MTLAHLILELTEAAKKDNIDAIHKLYSESQIRLISKKERKAFGLLVEVVCNKIYDLGSLSIYAETPREFL